MTNKSKLPTKTETNGKTKNERHIPSNDKVLFIDQRIEKLKQKRERLKTHQALFFTKEAQKILGACFSPEMALTVLEKTWSTASEGQKKEWQMHTSSFRVSSSRPSQKALPHNPKSEQITLSKDHLNELS